jgi:threonine/homoserine/homoserine lactone efflux protein
MNSLTFWLVFFSAALALNLSPGPDLIYILSRTLSQGRRVGIASGLGVCTGALVHVFAAAAGLSAVLASSAMAFSAVKFIGAAYLAYLGIRALLSAGSAVDVSSDGLKRVNPGQAFRQGMLMVQAAGPKARRCLLAPMQHLAQTLKTRLAGVVRGMRDHRSSA